MTGQITENSPSEAMRPRVKPFDIASWSLAHPQPFLCDLRVTAAHLSRTIDHVSNVEYVGWLDRAAELHADHLGFPRAKLLEDGVMWFVGRHEIDYVRETFLHDELVIATWVRNMGKVKSWRESVIMRPSDGAVVCRAATLWVLVNLATRKPIRMTPSMIGKFGALQP